MQACLALSPYAKPSSTHLPCRSAAPGSAPPESPRRQRPQRRQQQQRRHSPWRRGRGGGGPAWPAPAPLPPHLGQPDHPGPVAAHCVITGTGFTGTWRHTSASVTSMCVIKVESCNHASTRYVCVCAVRGPHPSHALCQHLKHHLARLLAIPSHLPDCETHHYKTRRRAAPPPPLSP